MPELVAAGATDIHVPQLRRAFVAGIRPTQPRPCRRDRRRRDSVRARARSVAACSRRSTTIRSTRRRCRSRTRRRGDPNHYDRYWFNGYREDFYFAVGMAVYPNRGHHRRRDLDGARRRAALGVRVGAHAGRPHADAGRSAVDRDRRAAAHHARARRRRRSRHRRRRHVHGAHGRARRTAPDDDERHAADDGLDPPDAVGHVVGRDHDRWRRRSTFDALYGTKDRSWGVRPVGAARRRRARPDACRRSSSSGRRSTSRTGARTSSASSAPNGDRIVGSQAVLDVIGAERSDVGRRRPRSSTSRAPSPTCGGRPGLRRSQGATSAHARCATTAARNASSSSRC